MMKDQNEVKPQAKPKPAADLLIGLIVVYVLFLIAMSSLPFSALWPPSPWLRFIGFAVLAIPISAFVLCLRRALLGVDFGRSPKQWLLWGIVAVVVEAVAEFGFNTSLNVGFFGGAFAAAGLGAVIGTTARKRRNKNTEQAVGR